MWHNGLYVFGFPLLDRGARGGATSRKVVGLIPDGVIGIFHWHNPSGRTVALGYSASNRNEYQEYFLGSKGGRCLGLTTLPPSCANCLEIWEPQPPGNLRACPGRNGIALLYLLGRLLWFVGGVRASVIISIRNEFFPCVAGCGARRGDYLVTGS